MARSYDFWSSMQKRMYHPNGTMKTEYREELMKSGTTLFDTLNMEAIQMKEVKDFEEREQLYLEQFGETFSQMTARRSEKLTLAQQQKRQQQALDSGEELSSLPYHMEPDEYYDYYADYPC